MLLFLFFKQKTAYELRISDWSSDVCSSDLALGRPGDAPAPPRRHPAQRMQRVSHKAAALQRHSELLLLPGGVGACLQVLQGTAAAGAEEGTRSEERRVGKRVCQYV